MSVRSDILLVDIGNTQIKYTRYVTPQRIGEVQETQVVAQLASAVASAERVIVSCVGKQEKAAELAAMCESAGVSLTLVKTAVQAFGIRCAYQTVENLGVDRWLAVLAARQVTQLPVAVIDVGTAMTCDFVVGDRHLGGWIAPGFELMKQALVQNTQRVFARPELVSTLGIGQDTPECVNYGCLAALRGVLEIAQATLCEHGDDYKIIISGGGAGLLDAKESENVVLMDNIVLRGLARFAEKSSD